MYTLQPDLDLTKTSNKIVKRDTDHAFVPFHPDNIDYQQFVRDIKSGAQLNDAEGNPITGSALTTFLATLP